MITTSQEAYVPSSDTYIEKDSSVNDEIDKLRHSATSALLERNDVIVVASVSCIYGLVRRRNMPIAWWVCVQVWRFLVIVCSMTWWISSLSAMTSTFNGEIPCSWGCGRDFPSFARWTCLSGWVFGDEIERIREIEALDRPGSGEMWITWLFSQPLTSWPMTTIWKWLLPRFKRNLRSS